MRTTVFLLVALTASVAFGREAESSRKWHEDIAYFRQEVPRRHINAFHDLTREEFERMTNDLDRRVESSTDADLIVGLARIVAHLGSRDGHSRMNLLNEDFKFHKLPLNLYWYPDGLFIRAASTEYAALLGSRIVAINGVPVDDALTRALDISSGDNPMSRKWWPPMLLIMPEVLHSLGIGSGDPAAPVTLQLDTKTVQVTPVASLDKVESQDIRRRGTIPMYLRWASLDPFEHHGAQKNFWYEYQPDNKLLYVNYSEVSNAKDETVAQFFGRVFEFADSHPVDRFVLDIRNNGGGNNYLNRPIVDGLISRAKTIAKRGTLFVIISRNTYSAAQNLANQLDDHTDAIFVGEPTGGSPNHFGDALRMTLPNSKVAIQLSSVWWQDLDPRDFRPWIAPQITAELTSADDRSGRDPSMEAILAYQPEPPLGTQIRSALERGGKAEAQRALEAWRSQPQHKYATIENDLVQLGLDLFRAKKEADALTAFELNAAANPDSWNARNNLGRAYASVGRKQEALAAFEQALRMRPNAPQTLNAMDQIH